MTRLRLLAPVGVAGAIALGAWIPAVTSATAAAPSLPPLTAEQLLVKVQAVDVAGLSGTVRLASNLGLPGISGLNASAGQSPDHGGFDPISLLSGNHDISVWEAGAGKLRLALPGTLQETDLVHNGANTWLFDSSTDKVVDYVARPGSGGGHDAAPAGVPPRDQETTTCAVATRLCPSFLDMEPTTAHVVVFRSLTPDQAAQQLLAHLDPSTVVSVASPVYVAGRPTYQLVLQPRAAASTVDHVAIAVDAATGLPLQVEVTAKGATAPALSLGFRSVTFAVPAAGNFAAPSGTSTTTKPLDLGRRDHPAGPAHDSEVSDSPAPGSGDGTSTSGSGWATVGVFHLSGATAGHRVDQATTAVSGAWGSGRLLTTNLLNALILPDGKVLAGFVTAGTLEAAAASAG